MSSGELISIDPLELKFHFKLNKQMKSSLRLTNNTDKYVGYKVKINKTGMDKYGVRHNIGVVLPRSTCEIKVYMQAQKEAPVNMQCKDKFLIQSVVVNLEDNTIASPEDIARETFTKESEKVMNSCKLNVVYLPSTLATSAISQGAQKMCPYDESRVDKGILSGHEIVRRFLMYFGVKSGQQPRKIKTL